MKLANQKTPVELRELFYKCCQNGNFQSYFTNHSNFRMIRKGSTAICQDRSSGLSRYYGLEGSLEEFREFAKDRGCDEKTSFAQAILCRVS